ncbi:MAG: response regulator [Burkholderiales bacterium]|nr:response regulator [Burkholderiales bacterium]
MRIRTHLVLMATAVLLPVALAAGIALEKIRDGERDAALRGLRETVRATALIVDREAQGSLSALKALGLSEHLETGNFKAFYAQATAMNQPPDVWTLLLDSQGRQILNTVAPYGTPPPPPSAQARVAQVLGSGKPLITDLFVGPVTGKLLTTIYVPAAAGGGKSMVVAQGFSVDHWKKTALQRELPADWIVAVIDRQGRFIARSHKTGDLLGQAARPELVAAAAAAQDGLIRHSTVEGVESYDAFAHSSLTGWTIAVAAPVQSIEAAAGRAIQVALAGMLLAVGAAIFAAAAFGQRFIRAIESAGRAAVALGRGEKPRVRATALDEVNELNQALVEAGTLLAAERQQRQAAEAERERLLAGEMSAREAAQAQNVAKDQFLAMLGHELRNPLAAISGATSLLEIGGVGKDRSGRYLEIIRRQNRHLGHIVNDLLDVSRLMAGKITLEPHPLNLGACVTSCVEALRATERAIGYRITVRAGAVWIDGDAVRIEQILNNLITNALKFSPASSEIVVEVHHDGGKAVVSVRDAGAGISADLLPRVFDPFMQGPPPQNRMQSGLGIGLALVKQLVELHGGVVHATSGGQGEGATFTFWIPSIPAPGSAAPAGPATTGSGRRLLYVEDNPDARETMAELLRSFGYQVAEAGDGLGAVAAVLAARPDAVLLDIGLPDIDGYEVARRLRANPATQFIPLVALTGYGQLRDKESAALAGFDAHLVKPVDPQQLMHTIEQVLSRTAVA